jgi:very-short-patch-repair endonuclease
MPKKAKMPKKLSEGEELLALQCRAYGIEFEREIQFLPPRKWRFDFLFAKGIAVEVDGGTAFGKSSHSRGDGYENDCRKANAATIAGYRLLRFTTAMIQSAEAIDFLREIFK